MLTEEDCMLLEGVQRFPDVYCWGFNVSHEILGRRLNLQEAQKELGVNIDMTKDYPLGDMDTKKKLFFLMIKKGDEIRKFDSPRITGIALLRNGKVINGFVTGMFCFGRHGWTS